MPGLLIFTSLTQALSNGFQVYDRTAEGYLVRRSRPAGGWEMALVHCSDKPKE